MSFSYDQPLSLFDEVIKFVEYETVNNTTPTVFNITLNSRMIIFVSIHHVVNWNPSSSKIEVLRDGIVVSSTVNNTFFITVLDAGQYTIKIYTGFTGATLEAGVYGIRYYLG